MASEGLDQPVHLCSLITATAILMRIWKDSKPLKNGTGQECKLVRVFAWFTCPKTHFFMAKLKVKHYLRTHKTKKKKRF